MITLAAAVCAATLMVNKTDEKWTDADIKTLYSAASGCKKHYPDLPCLVKFTKTATRTYQALCGPKKDDA